MRLSSAIMWSLAIIAPFAACGGGSSGSGSSSGGAGGGGGSASAESQVQGTWVGCQSGAGFSDKTVLVVSGSSFTSTSTTHANGTCAGTGTLLSNDTGTFALGGAVTANLGATPVTAYAIDGTRMGVTFYDLVYVNTGVTPNRMYNGQTTATNDGSTPAKRPTALDASYFLAKQ